MLLVRLLGQALGSRPLDLANQTVWIATGAILSRSAQAKDSSHGHARSRLATDDWFGIVLIGCASPDIPGSAIPRDADSASRSYLALVIADRTDSAARAIMTPAGGRDVQPVLKQLSALLRDANLDSARFVGAHTFRVSFLNAA